MITNNNCSSLWVATACTQWVCVCSVVYSDTPPHCVIHCAHSIVYTAAHEGVTVMNYITHTHDCFNYCPLSLCTLCHSNECLIRCVFPIYRIAGNFLLRRAKKWKINPRNVCYLSQYSLCSVCEDNYDEMRTKSDLVSAIIIMWSMKCASKRFTI